MIGLLLSSWYQYSFDNYLIEHLFVKQEKNDGEISGKDDEKGIINQESGLTEKMDKSKTRFWFMKCTKLLRSLACCKCRLNKEERLFKRAKSILSDETDIVVLLKRMRRFEKFMQSIVSSEGDVYLKQAELKVVSLSSEDDQKKPKFKGKIVG